METSILRNEQSIENLSNLGLPIERVDAVTPSNYKEHSEEYGLVTSFDDIPKVNSENPKIYNVHTKRSPRWSGDICCSLSHVKAIREAMKQNLKRVMICEDDFVYLQDESKLFYENIDKLPEDFDVIHITSLLHSNYNNAFKGNKFIDYSVKGSFVNDFVFRIKGGLLGTGAYIVNLENKEWVDEYCNILMKGASTDCVMSFRLQEKYKHFTTRFKLGYQDYLSPTTIARTKGIDFSINNPRIKWLMGITFNTPWTILDQRNKKMVERIIDGYDNDPII